MSGQTSSALPSEVRFTMAVSFAIAVAMIAQQVAGKAVRDAYFLTVFEAEVLARIMTVSSILSVVAVLLVTRLYRRFSPATLVPVFFALSAGLFLAEWSLVVAGIDKLAAVVLYLHTASLGAVAISGFWAVMNERFDPHTAKKVVGRVASGATMGGVVGGIAAWQGAGTVSLSVMLLALFAVNAGCCVGIFLVGRGVRSERKDKSEEEDERSAPWQIFEDTPYLRKVAALVVLVAFGTAGVDYAFKATAASSMSDSAELVSFFALFYLATGVAAFLVQNGFANWFVGRFGVAPAVASLPLMLLIFGPVALLAPGLFSMALLRGSASTIESSSYRSGYELLYTPLPAKTKRPAKTLIDVGGDKLGAAVGSAFAVFLVGLMPGAANTLLIIGGVVCGFLALTLSRWLARGYVDALAARLSDAQQSSGREGGTPSARRRRRTRASIEAASVPALGGADAVDLAGLLRGSTEQTPDLSAVTSALRRLNPVPRPYVGALIPLVNKPDYGEAIAGYLSRGAPGSLGTLLDGLFDPSLPPETRVRMAEIVSGVPTQRCANGLSAGLHLRPFVVRNAAARALRDIVAKNPRLRVHRKAVLEAIHVELEKVRRRYSMSGLARMREGTGPARSAGQRLGHCVTLLSVFLPAEALELALEALGSDDPRQWGTGLEYIENILPDDVRELAVPIFGNRVVARAARDVRERPMSAQETKTSPSLAELRARLRARAAAG